MTLRIIIIFLIFFFFGYKVFYYKEPFNSNILKTEIDIENGPTPYNYVIPSSTPALSARIFILDMVPVS